MTTLTTLAGRVPVDRRFTLTWIALVTIGFVSAMLVGLQVFWGLGEALQQPLGETAAVALGAAAFGAIFGLCIGGAQAIALRKRLPHPLRWLAASVVGSALPLAILVTIFGDGQVQVPNEIIALVGGGLLGLGMGVAQWLAVRSQGQKMAWWVLVSMVGMIAGWFVALTLGSEDLMAPAVLLGGLFAGAITGLGMAWLLKE